MAAPETITRDGAHDPRAIANFILDVSEKAGRRVTVMQLIKLVYIADGWSLALLGKPLSKHAPQAWQYGPVYPSLYNALKRFGSQPVTGPLMVAGTAVPYEEEFTADEARLITMVTEGYGKLSAFALSNLTHQAETPWSAAKERGDYSAISAEDMKTHFESLREKRLVKA